jgi:hypothetical protein
MNVKYFAVTLRMSFSACISADCSWNQALKLGVLLILEFGSIIQNMSYLFYTCLDIL